MTNRKAHPSTPGSDRVGLVVPTKGTVPVSHARTWKDNVAEGRRLVSEISDRKWELGDLANGVCPSTGTTANDDHRISKFAAEIGIAATTLREYRRVSAAWPLATRVASQTWTTHRLLVGREDRLAVIAEKTWTYNSLTDWLGILPNPSRLLSDGRATSVGDVVRALADPAVAEQFMQTDQASAFVKKAIKSSIAIESAADRAVEEAAADRHSASPKPKVRDRDKAERLSIAMLAATRAQRSLKDFAGEVSGVNFTEAETAAINAFIDNLRAALDLIHAGVNSGTWDDELAELLRSQS